jgi:hypothetical protein
MVEKFIRENSNQYSRRKLWEKLPKKVMWQTFLVILEYLHDLGKITINFQDKLEFNNPSSTKVENNLEKQEAKEERIINSPCYIG